MRFKTLTAAACAALAIGTIGASIVPDAADAQQRRYSRWYRTHATVNAGTPIQVRLDSRISTEHAQRGDAWAGTVAQSVYEGDAIIIPAGSPVSGVVTSAAHGTHSTRPHIGLAVRRVTVNGRSQALYADSDPIIAGSKRAKKIGAIAGGAAAGALLGGAVSKSKRGALIGGLLGGAASYGLTRDALRTLQLKEGTVVDFTVRNDVAVRR